MKRTAGLLNVRSGPGRGHPVVRQVPAGSRLTVVGTAPDWIYVRLADGAQGWVMQRYTAPAVEPRPASG